MNYFLKRWLPLMAIICVLFSGCSSTQGPTRNSTDGSRATTTIAAGQTVESDVGNVTNSTEHSTATTALKTTTKNPVTTTEKSAATTTEKSTLTSSTTKREDEPTEIGVWYSTWYGYTKPGSDSNVLDTWNAWGIQFKPLMPDGSFNYYDSTNVDVIQFHLQKMSEAQIDFIVMDQTNNIDVDGGYINARSIVMAKRIKEYNDSGARPVRYCSAIGGIQWSQNAATIEEEAKKLWTRYVSQPFGSDKYHYYYEGKPVLVVYGDGAEAKWNAYTGDKTYGSKFTIRWADNNSTPGYWGWAYTKGAQWDGETTVVMPGWHNRVGHTPVNRNYGETYKAFWRKILQTEERPRIIIINSFNEYAERTAIFPAVADPDTLPGDKWYKDESKEEDPYMYWNMTVDFIKKFKAMNKPLYNSETIID